MARTERGASPPKPPGIFAPMRKHAMVFHIGKNIQISRGGARATTRQKTGGEAAPYDWKTRDE